MPTNGPNRNTVFFMHMALRNIPAFPDQFFRQLHCIILRPIMKMTHFGNGLVMGSADCINYVGLVKTLEKLFKRKSGLCQTHCRQVPVFSRLSKYSIYTLHTNHASSSYLRVNMGCALVILFQVHSLYVPTKDRLPLRGHFWESLYAVNKILVEVGRTGLKNESYLVKL